MPDEPFRLGTRGSALARRQAEVVAADLTDRRYDVEIVEVETTGDRIRDELVHRLGKTGAFVRDLDERVLDGDLDAAVHSLKDMPTTIPDGLVVAAVPTRASAHDVLVTWEGLSLAELPEASTVGTGSLRRRAQLERVRPDLSVEPIRGNVDTRLEKLVAPALQQELARLGSDGAGNGSDGGGEDGNGDTTATAEANATASGTDADSERTAWLEDRSPLERAALEREVDVTYDALVLAAAGLERAGLEGVAEPVPLGTDRFVPAAGQGALAVTMRDGDVAESVHRWLDHPPSRVAVTVERTILGTVGGGCIAPIGVHAVVQGAVVKTRVDVSSTDGATSVTATRELPIETHGRAAKDLAEELADEGARELIEAAATDATDEPDPP